MTDDPHSHDLGFAHDLPRMLGRRRFLTVLGGLGLGAAGGAQAMANVLTALPWETQGPYPADGTVTRGGTAQNVLTEAGVIRRDLRPSFGALTPVAEGVQLDLDLRLANAADGAPLDGHAIYVWHCDTVGDYSLYDIEDANFLRGVGVADADGRVSFTTIFPGCYDGRWPHIHFEVFESAEAAVSGAASVLTAQMAFPEADCAAVYAADARYPNGTRNLGRITLSSDNVFADNTAAQLTQQTVALTGAPDTGYRGTLTIPVDFDAERSAGMAPPAGGFPGGEMPPKPGE
ncbi:hypothetical protein [Actibacterium ureilyticum]|uniref:dioxygenase family protein n=1 Tax=Actibacterium ureilyticum TaxID=1590614 RepID=UPI001C3F12D3|nr:hypothetical protein [Actibacterium ureilyticum]